MDLSDKHTMNFEIGGKKVTLQLTRSDLIKMQKDLSMYLQDLEMGDQSEYGYYGENNGPV